MAEFGISGCTYENVWIWKGFIRLNMKHSVDGNVSGEVDKLGVACWQLVGTEGSSLP